MSLHAYAAVLQGEADLALVLDNALWKGVIAVEVGRGSFQLYCKEVQVALKPVLLAEDQMEVLSLQQSWQQIHGYPLPIKSRIPSWSLIAHICAESGEIGFLPDFLAKKRGLEPVFWELATSAYRVLATHKGGERPLQERLQKMIVALCLVFKEDPLL